MALMDAADGLGLESLVRRDRRVVRHVLGRLWDPDKSRRRLAARALGAAAEAHPELAVDLARRLIWGLNDESATNGVYGIAALGEMAGRCPRLMAPFVGPMASFMWDDGLRPEILRALRRIVDSDPTLIEEARETLERHLHSNNPEQRRQIADLLGTQSGDVDED